MTSSWFFLSTLNYDARSTTRQINGEVFGWCMFLLHVRKHNFRQVNFVVLRGADTVGHPLTHTLTWRVIFECRLSWSIQTRLKTECRFGPYPNVGTPNTCFYIDRYAEVNFLNIMYWDLRGFSQYLLLIVRTNSAAPSSEIFEFKFSYVFLSCPVQCAQFRKNSNCVVWHVFTTK